MGGIGDYFHGETGRAEEFFWVLDGKRLFFEMALSGNPHRERALDYGSDIGIDPGIKPGSEVRYIRLDDTCGLWVEKGNEFTPELEQSLARCLRNREKYLENCQALIHNPMAKPESWLSSLAAASGFQAREPERSMRGTGQDLDRPAAPISIFLSYKHQDVLLAREMYDYLKGEAKVDVWFDLAQPGKSTAPGEQVSEWLRTAIYECQLFLVLATRIAMDSVWVMKEVGWALEKARSQSDFHPILLNLANLTLPAEAQAMGHILECRFLSIGEILEETYALVYGRPGRRRWIENQLKRGWRNPQTKPHDGRYAETEAGEAINFNWEWRGKAIHWVLEYEKGGIKNRVEGHGRDQVIDLEIRPHDRIAYYLYERHIPVWMRSDDLSLSARDVVRNYARVSSSPPPGSSSEPRAFEAPPSRLAEALFTVPADTAAARPNYKSTTVVTLAPDSPGHDIIPHDIIPPAPAPVSNAARIGIWLLYLGGGLVVGLIEWACFMVFPSRPGTAAPEFDPAQVPIFRSAIRGLLATNILLFGIFFLAKFSRPLREGEFRGFQAIASAVASIVVVALATAVLPILTMVGVYVASLIVIGIPLSFVERVFGIRLPMGAQWAFLLFHGVFLVYFAFRTHRVLSAGGGRQKSPGGSDRAL